MTDNKNKKMIYILGGIITLLLLIICILAAVSIYILTNLQTNSAPVSNGTVSISYGNDALPPANPAPQPQPAPAPSPNPVTTKVFENSYMKFSYPSDWTVTAASDSQINVEKGKYILYINTQFTQASGVQGGRFNEISGGAPSADAVMKVQPSGPCGTSETTTITGGFEPQTREDLFVSSSDSSEVCNAPTSGNVWYFSYISSPGTSYINYYGDVGPKGYAITMSYKSSDVNSFPEEGSTELNARLSEMTDIVKSLGIKIL